MARLVLVAHAGRRLAAAMVVLAFLVLTPSTQREGLRTLAVLSGDQAQAALVLNRLPDKSLSVQPMRDLTLLAGGRALELWAITPGLPPRSLGLVLPGQTSRLNPRLPPLPGDTVAVTLEPPGVRPPAPPPVRWCSAAPSSDRARRHQGLSQVRRAHPSARLPRISLRRPTKKEIVMKRIVCIALACSALALSSAQAADVVVGGQPMLPGKTIVANALNSADHTTLVAAVKAAGLVDTLQSKGPFTVFAPTNAAFGKLPAGTVDTLVKPENKATLTKILTYHVVPGKLDFDALAAQIKKAGGAAELTTASGGKLW